MKRAVKALIVVAGVCAVLAAGYAGLRLLRSGRAEVSYLTRPVGFADITSSVTETGTVNPVNEVDVGTEVSGTIATLGVDYNSVVHAGQVLATLDPTTFQAAVDSANASLKLAQANLANARNNVQKAKAQRDLAKLTLERDQELAKQALIPQSQIDSDQTSALAAELDYRSSLGTVEVAQTQVSVAQAQLEQAKYNLGRTVITSPIDGIVLARNVSVGQSVAASLQAPTLFVLATSLVDMQVDTAVDEADVGAVQSGQPAQITVTAYPNTSFEGTVKQVRVNPTTVQNVVTYDAVVEVHDTSSRLLPGMTAQVTIQTGSRPHVLSVPIAALLYRPTSERGGSSFGGTNGGRFVGFGVIGGGARGAGRNGSNGSSGQSPIAGAPGSRLVVWLLRDGRPVPAQITIGLSDERNVEITSGDIRAGDQVIVSERRGRPVRSSPENSGAAASGRSSPGFPRNGEPNRNGASNGRGERQRAFGPSTPSSSGSSPAGNAAADRGSTTPSAPRQAAGSASAAAGSVVTTGRSDSASGGQRVTQ